MKPMVKTGDAVLDIMGGLNADMRTIGLSVTDNEMGIALTEVDSQSSKDLHNRSSATAAHYIVDSIADLPDAMEES